MAESIFANNLLGPGHVLQVRNTLSIRDIVWICSETRKVTGPQSPSCQLGVSFLGLLAGFGWF